jgi:hypothetical protein
LEFRRTQRLAEGGIEQLDERELFTAAPAGGNSAAILMKHMAGNMLSRWRDFLTSDGEKPDRNRDAEFVITDGDDRASLEARWEAGWACLFDAIAPLADADLARTVTIRGEAHSVLQAINRQLSHYAYHAGQIVLLAKTQRGLAWRTLSVAKGQSEAFNADPDAYLDGKT